MGWPSPFPLTRRRALHWRSAIVVLPVLLVVLGCSGSDPGPPDPPGPDVNLVGTWIPREVPTAEWGPDFHPSSAKITFNDDGSWSAQDPCNKVLGTYEINGSGFSSPPPSGEVGVECAGGSVEYPTLLAQARTVQVDRGEARFTDGDGTLLIRLERVDGRRAKR